MRIRPVLFAATAAAGLTALGPVVAQPPPPAGGKAAGPSAPVRPTGDWTPGPTPPGSVPKGPPAAGGAYLPPPPGYNPGLNTGPAGGPRPRLTNPAVAGPTGVRPAGGFDVPPPSMDLPPFGPQPAPAPAADPPGTKFPAGPPGPLPAMSAAPALAPPTVTLVPAVPSAPVPTAAPPAPPPAGPPLAARAAPMVVVEAVCPEAVGFGQEFVYKLVVRNAGDAAVAAVRVEDEVPPGVRYVGSDPPAEPVADRLTWALGPLDPGAERTITVRVRPGDEAEVRSRATVTFAAAVDARTRVTRPRLAVALAAADQCRAGDEAVFQIKLTNTGTGPAGRLFLHARMTDGLHHPQARAGSVEAELPALAAGETRTVPLRVTAAAAGQQSCQVTVTADGSPDATAKAGVAVVEPLLVVRQAGPARCVVRAEPTYAIELTNPGTAATDPVVVQTALPDGFEFVGASDGGAAAGRTVTWRLPGLAPRGEARAVTLKLRAVAAADAGVLRTVARTDPGAPVTPAGGPPAARPPARGLEAQAETAVAAEGVAAVRFEVVGLDNPAEVGKDVTYEIRVMNQGTGPCSNVQVSALLADGTEFVGATAGPAGQPAAARAQGQHVAFDPIPALGVKAETVYRVKVKGTVAGDLRFRVQLGCDQLRSPLVKEESTRFYRE